MILKAIHVIIASMWQSILIWCISILTPIGPKAGKVQRIFIKMIGVHVKGNVYFGKRIQISYSNRLFLGNGVAIGDDASLICHANIIIGEDFLSAPGLIINSGNHDVRTMVGYGQNIIIGARVWCGARVTICSGVTIGDDVVIGAGSVVVKSIPSNSIVAGVPAKVISSLERDLNDYYRVNY